MSDLARKNLWGASLSVILLVITFGCRETPVQPPELQSLSATGDAYTITGDIGPGSKYAIFVPANWNGDLIIYAHGFIDSDKPTELPTGDGWVLIRDGLLDLGYAIAYSSYSENGLAIKDGAQRTRQLESIFTSKIGAPARKYLVAHSLGGAVALMLAEKHPDRYDGALIMCGIIGGSQAEIDYIATVRVLFDFFYPGCLPGDAMNVPPDTDVSAVITAVVTCILTDPMGAGAIPCFAPVPFATPDQLVESIATAIAFNVRGFEDIFDRTHGNNPFDNSSTVYSCPLLPQELLDAINAGVDRFETTPDAAEYLEHYYEPTGKVQIPIFTLHTDKDPVVPYFHEDLYKQRVAAAGRSDYLAQRVIDQYGHCKFGADSDASTAEAVKAFQDLVNWVENGVKPTP